MRSMRAANGMSEDDDRRTVTEHCGATPPSWIDSIHGFDDGRSSFGHSLPDASACATWP